jgi:hypothetical protein
MKWRQKPFSLPNAAEKVPDALSSSGPADRHLHENLEVFRPVRRGKGFRNLFGSLGIEKGC